MGRRCIVVAAVAASLVTGMAADNGAAAPKQRAVSWGIKAGFKAAMPDVRRVAVTDVTVGDVQVIRRVGLTGELFGRIHLKHFFIQPSVAWSFSRSQTRFTTLRPPLALIGDDEPTTVPQAIETRLFTVEVPVLAGFHLVKEEPYKLYVLLGPKLRYDYRPMYNTSATSGIRYVDTPKPYGVSLYTGLGMAIGRLLFDVGYEYGLNSIGSRWVYAPEYAAFPRTMRLAERRHAMTMSVGILF